MKNLKMTALAILSAGFFSVASAQSKPAAKENAVKSQKAEIAEDKVVEDKNSVNTTQEIKAVPNTSAPTAIKAKKEEQSSIPQDQSLKEEQ